MLHALSVLVLAANPAPVPVVGLQDLLDFSRRPADAEPFVDDAGHRLVPEADGPSRWSFEAGVLTASSGWDSLVTPKVYDDFRMHLEFRVNAAENEQREKNGNSGVYVQQRYEVQILDSYGVPWADHQAWDCASLYRLKRPDHNASRPAEAWQSYDIVFRAARFEGERKVENARITVFHNDVLIHEDVELARKTGAGKPEGPEPGPIKLQGHGNPVGFRDVWVEALRLDAMPVVPAADPRRVEKSLPLPGRVFPVGGRTAFVIEPPSEREGPTPWVWYAPTLPRLPGEAEVWMFERLLAQGIAIAGIDVGESYGSPAGRAGYQDLYAYLTSTQGFARRPALLARSRGGLMLYSWAAEHPASVAGVAGIYPVCDLRSYPGLERAAPAYGLEPHELEASLADHNPVARLQGLAAARVPILHLHGDADGTVPLGPNSRALADRYRALGGPVELLVFEGRGHDMWSGWFESEALTEFLIRRAKAGAQE